MGSVMTCCTDSEETKPEGEEGEQEIGGTG